MKLRVAVIAMLCLGVGVGLATSDKASYAQGKKAGEPAMPVITVYNPMGTPPPITLKPQAPRLDKLDGKTIYFLNTGFIGTDRLMAEMSDWFKANYPQTKIVYKDGSTGAGLDSLSEALWKEIEQNGDAAIVGLGH